MRTLRIRLIAAATGVAAAVGLGLAGSLPSAHGVSATGDGVSATDDGVAATDPVGPPQDDFASAFAYALLHPTAVPSGANDWDCRPDAARPRPVVLVHGTFENRYVNWAGLAPRLKQQGYCVFATNHGGSGSGPVAGTGDLALSAGQLAAFVDRVRSATGAAKVDLVGHSQGGMMPRHYIKSLGGAAKVDKLIALAPTNHGTSLWGLGLLAAAFPGGRTLTGATCTACSQQVTGSDFLEELNQGGETHPDVTYTVIVTRHDEVVSPYTSGYLAPRPNVTNQKVQGFCPLNTTEHVDISYDAVAERLVLNALDPARAVRPRC
ncbi:esterase/lipase family protein [Streptomyces tritici]|uniref:esterase/lipase family protein n=1 Tax=Streptomyces tritici TaxID=2054410 RepID=UPI003AF1C40C